MLHGIKFSLNKEVIWLKILYTLYGFGIMIILPYFPLQMASLGLNDVDISYITGVIPLVVTFTTPFLGLLSDTIGYKSVLLIDIILLSLSTTSYIFIPGYQEGQLQKPFANITNETLEITSIQWPVDSSSGENCTDSWKDIIQSNWLENITHYINCDLNVSLVADNFMLNNKEVEGFCIITDPNLAYNQSTFTCNIDTHPYFIENRYSSFGNHRQTFWLAFGLQTIITIACNIGWAIWDTVSITAAVNHNSSYAAIIFWALTGQAIAPFVSAWTIKDGVNGINDYSTAYFTNDCVMLLVLTFVVWKLKDSKNDKDSKDKVSHREALKQMLSVPMLILLIGIGTTGLILGVHMTYLYLYLQRDLNASSQLISYMNNIAFGCQAAFLLVSDYVVDWVGCVNAISINIFVEVIKLIVYAYVEQNPPYYALGLHVLNFTLWGFSWVAMLKYAYRITPPQLTGTIVGIVMVFCTQICHSVAGLGGGQLLQRLNWTIPDILRLTAVIGSAGGVLYLLTYYFFGRKYEKILVEKLDQQYPERWNANSVIGRSKEVYLISDFGTAITSL